MIDAAKSKGETSNKEEQEEEVLEDIDLAEGEEEEADDGLELDVRKKLDERGPQLSLQSELACLRWIVQWVSASAFYFKWVAEALTSEFASGPQLSLNLRSEVRSWRWRVSRGLSCH